MSLDQQKQWYRHSLPLKRQVIVDVGANVGELSQFFWDQGGPKTELISVEPHPSNIKAIEKRIRKAGSKRWKLKRCAVSAEQGHVSLRLLETRTGDNAMVVAEAGDLTVACVPLPQLAPNATVVKLDVEGHEYTILPAAVPVMRTVTAWAVELHCVVGHPLEETLELFADHGFSLVSAGHRVGDTQWLSVPIEPSLSWNDVPGVRAQRDGRTYESKMLHVIASR